MVTKRKLTFDSLDQAIIEAESLLANGYSQIGKWNFAQCCGHLTYWLSFPMVGFPKPNFVMAGMLWVMKYSFGLRQLKSILASGFKSGLPTMPDTVPAADAVKDHEAMLELKIMVDRFNNHNGPIHPSPLFGPMDKETATLLQLRHFEHHLGFFKSKH